MRIVYIIPQPLVAPQRHLLLVNQNRYRANQEPSAAPIINSMPIAKIISNLSSNNVVSPRCLAINDDSNRQKPALNRTLVFQNIVLISATLRVALWTCAFAFSSVLAYSCAAILTKLFVHDILGVHAGMNMRRLVCLFSAQYPNFSLGLC